MAKKVNASHILVKTEQEALVVSYDVTHGKDFAEVAKEKSLCPSKKNGGNLACFIAKKGDIVGPVKTQFGYHIIRIEDCM